MISKRQLEIDLKYEQKTNKDKLETRLGSSAFCLSKFQRCCSSAKQVLPNYLAMKQDGTIGDLERFPT
jgi:hypothetical protein